MKEKTDKKPASNKDFWARRDKLAEEGRKRGYDPRWAYFAAGGRRRGW